MTKAQRIKYNMWLDKAQGVANICNIELYQFLTVVDKINDLRSIYNSVECDDFLQYYFNENKQTKPLF